MPNLLIVDYRVGLPGSQHNATAWAGTWLPQEHEVLFARGEWVWGDSAYPLQKWCQAPYKKYVSYCTTQPVTDDAKAREGHTRQYSIQLPCIEGAYSFGTLHGLHKRAVVITLWPVNSD